jgi:hypothetical protein
MTELFTGATGLFVAATIVYLIKRDRLQVRHGVSWMLVAALFALFGFARRYWIGWRFRSGWRIRPPLPLW